MTRILTFSGLLAIIGILLAASAVYFGEEQRQNGPRLAVSISGVPGYVYYSRDYLITFEYANHGGGTAKNVTLSATLPRDFSLSDSSASVEEQAIVWQLGDLQPGERGTVSARLRGKVPSDLTGAVYDLPNYVGHTAFVDGLSIDVTLASSAGNVVARASADTGLQVDPPEGSPNTITIIKEVEGDGSRQDFTFDPGGNCLTANPPQVPVPCPANTIINLDQPFILDDDDPDDPDSVITPDRRTFAVNFPPRINARHSITEIVPEGWEITNIACEPEGDGGGTPQFAEFAFAAGDVVTGPDYNPAYNEGDDTVWFNITNNSGGFLICTFTNRFFAVGGAGGGGIRVHKETSSEIGEEFDFEMTGTLPHLDRTFSLGDEETETIHLPRGDYTIRELAADGWRVDEIDCEDEGQGDPLTGSVTISLRPDQWVDCTFTNVKAAASAAVPTPTAAGFEPNVSSALGGILAPPRRTPTAVVAGVAVTATPITPPRAAVAPTTISPPSTGDGGLR
jgi:hypothetical protein